MRGHRAGAIDGVAPAPQSDSIAVGYLRLPPLSPGVHRLRIDAGVPSFELMGDSEFIITVEKPRKR